MRNLTQQQKDFYYNKLVELLEIYNELQPILGDLKHEKESIVVMIKDLQKDTTVLYD